MKTITKSIILAASLSLPVLAQSLDQAKLTNAKRDLKIMTTILKTAVGDEHHESNLVDGLYLANQGMVFTIGSGHRYRFDFDDSFFSPAPAVPQPPAPPVAAMLSGEPLSEDQIEALQESTMAAVEVAMDMAESQIEWYSHMDWSSHSNRQRSEVRAQQKELKNERRELERESRKLERQVRNVERKLRDAEYQQELNDNKENRKKIEKLEAELKSHTESLAKVADKIKKKANALKAKAAEIKEKQLADLNAKIRKTEMAVSQAVCDFGSGLRSLEKGQFITINLQGRRDRVYVFDIKSINQCADGKINAEQLLAKTTQYQM